MERVQPYEKRWWALGVLILSLFVIALDNTIMNVTLPTLVRELGASATQLQWIVDAYVLVFAGLLLTAGSLGDRFGRKGALTIGLVLFGLGSAALPASAAEAPLRLPRPTWQPEFTWTYLRTPEKTPDQKRTIEYKVLYRVRVEDGDYYALQREGKEFFYSLDLGFRMTRGQRVERENRPFFPAFRGLWRGQRTWEERLDILVADQAPRGILGELAVEDLGAAIAPGHPLQLQLLAVVLKQPGYADLCHEAASRLSAGASPPRWLRPSSARGTPCR